VRATVMVENANTTELTATMMDSVWISKFTRYAPLMF
jgi:hypothetical protein